MRTRGRMAVDDPNKEMVQMADEPYMYVADCSPISADSEREPDSTEEMNANAAFIAMCFNTAHALDEAGYDGEKAIRELPELVKALNDTLDIAIRDIARAALDKIWGEHDRS